MTLRFTFSVVLPVFLLLGGGNTAAIQPNDASAPSKPASANPGESGLKSGSPTAATVEKIMEQAVRNIAARYNLNESQRKKTDELMRREVNRFLTEHEKEVWPIIRDLLSSQLRPPSDPEEVKRIGKAARPLSELAKKAILDANAEWRTNLSPEQQKMHDFDLAEMSKTFEQIDRNFRSWEEGKPIDSPIIPQPEVAERSPPRPTRPAEDLPPAEIQEMDVRVLDRIVELFIKEYELDPAQIDSARSILAEATVKANDFKEQKKQELAEIDAKQNAAREKRDLTAIADAEAARKILLEPFHELVRHMEERLKLLLTSAQIERHALRSPAGAAKPKATLPKGRQGGFKAQQQGAAPPKPLEGGSTPEPQPAAGSGSQPSGSATPNQPAAPAPAPSPSSEPKSEPK